MKNAKVLVAIVALAAIAGTVLILHISANDNGNQLQNVTVGSVAPNYRFFLANGSPASLSTYKGNITLLWFVATWCPSCAQGNEAINQNYQFFKQHRIKVVELELYKDLGYSGPSIAAFVDSYAAAAYSNGTIVPALASYNMTIAYDPHGYLDIYYLISGNGTVLYINGSPSATMSQLKQAINSSL
ncbi:MAG: thioredoxin family protein [Candidatus Micrarchaeaceae archaeon]